MEHIIYALIGLNVFQLLFWSLQVQKLVNKIMSGSFQAYTRAAKKETVVVEKNEDNSEPITLGDFSI